VCHNRATAIDAKEARMSTTKRDTPVLDLLTDMTTASIERSELDPKTLMLVRLAALAAVDAPPVSYLTNLAAARDVVEPEDVQQVLIGIAPVVGTPRVASAAGNIVRALGFAIAVADEDVDQEPTRARS
jgi:alkylhydroperoxidase/carboxymuconolactone decarboxylase family protein YurZ